MDAYGISQVTPGGTGIHLSWSGPRSWVYAPGGWTVRRRLADRVEARDCERLDAVAIAELRTVRERRLGFGALTLRPGGWLSALDGSGPPAEATPTEVFRLDLDAEHRLVRIVVTAKLSWAAAFCEGRVVGVSGPADGTATHVLHATRIDAAVVVTLDPTGLLLCVDVRAADEVEQWQDVPTIAERLTLPFRELMPELIDEADELAEARRRLLPGEDIGQEEFARLAAVIRPGLRAAGPPRPSELVMLLREPPDGDPDEARALDPIRVLLAHPTWRRALGFALFDDDPALVVGERYEYRISATFPAPDVWDANHGFATVPSGRLVPADFALAGLRLRIQQPVPVGLTPGTPTAGSVRITRRGIALDPRREWFWLHPTLDDWSLVIDFPEPVRSVILELAPDHRLDFAGGAATDPFAGTAPVPPGPRPRLDFGSPVEQLRLRGTGFLHAVRIPSVADGPLEIAMVLPPIALVDSPLPAAPLSASATGLQLPNAAPTELVPAAEPAARHGLGFRVRWRPAPAFGLAAWAPDLEAPPPLDATIFQIERRVEPDGPWAPVLDEANWTLGDRGDPQRDLTLTPGTDLMQVFSESGPLADGAALDLTLIDAFPTADDGAADGPLPGSMHRYRVRAVDAIGRPSPDWRETEPVRLEKHVPPPLPVGPEEPGSSPPGVPVGVQARVLVRDAPDLTPAEQTQLGSDDNAIVLRWGWHTAQREQDPFTREFRVYAAPPQDAVAGTVQAVSTLATGEVTSYRVELRLDRPVGADVAAGLRLDAGHPFLIRTHTAGLVVQMVVETRLRRADGTAPVPVVGPTRLALPLTPDRTRPPAWGSRVETRSVTASSSYEVVLRNRLLLDADHPVDTLWVGVSAADDQPYVPDQLAPLENRPGNESAVVPVPATGRYHGRPMLEIPAPLADVPQLRTPEPGAEPLHFPLDLTPFLPPGALTAARVRAERASAAAVVAACLATPDGRILGRPVEPTGPGDGDIEIPVPNPDDQAELAAALGTGLSTAVADRFLVYLAGRHPYRDRLFVPAQDNPQPAGPFLETLPPAGERWLYRVRAVDRAGHVSAGSATARVVVRVPSLLPGPAPMRAPGQPGDPPELLRVLIPPDPTLTDLLSFTAPVLRAGPIEVTEVLRVPNRPDLPPAQRLWLRGPAGELLAPAVTTLDGPTVSTGPDGTREVALTLPGGPGDRVRVWLATLTRDGVASPLAGPATVSLPPPPLPVPVLTVLDPPPGPRFGWSWPPGVDPAPRLLLALERSADGQDWVRVSPLLDPAGADLTVDQPPGSWRYRLRVTAPDGRTALSVPVEV